MSRRTHFRAFIALSATVLALLTIATRAEAQNIYYWYTPFASASMINTTTNPAGGSYVNDPTMPNWLPGRLLTNPGGIISDVNASLFGAVANFCNYYKLPVFSRPGPDAISGDSRRAAARARTGRDCDS